MRDEADPSEIKYGTFGQPMGGEVQRRQSRAANMHPQLRGAGTSALPYHQATKFNGSCKVIRAGSLFTVLALGVGLAQGGPLTISTYLEPDAENSAFWDVNNAGTAVGYSTVGGAARAMTWTEAGGFVPMSGPAGAAYSSASGISDGGVIVGSWGGVAAGPAAGFIYDGATYSSYSITGASETHLRAISPNGRYLTGYYSNATTDGQGFVLDTDTNVLTFIGAGGNDFTIVQGVSNSGMVVGSDLIYADDGTLLSRPGFTYDAISGVRIDVVLPGTVRTAFRAIDEAGVISGWSRAAFNSIGFTGYPGVVETLFVLGASDTYIEGSNNAGWLVGTAWWIEADDSYTTRAVLARPAVVPVPATLPLTLLALSVLALRRRATA